VAVIMLTHPVGADWCNHAANTFRRSKGCSSAILLAVVEAGTANLNVDGI
jgi:hypothetical protein